MAQVEPKICFHLFDLFNGIHYFLYFLSKNAIINFIIFKLIKFDSFKPKINCVQGTKAHQALERKRLGAIKTKKIQELQKYDFLHE